MLYTYFSASFIFYNPYILDFCFSIKYERLRDWDKVQKEQVNALRLVKQLEQLLYEMDTLRGQVEDGDIDKFDKLTAKARASTINAIQEYLGSIQIR